VFYSTHTACKGMLCHTTVHHMNTYVGFLWTVTNSRILLSFTVNNVYMYVYMYIYVCVCVSPNHETSSCKNKFFKVPFSPEIWLRTLLPWIRTCSKHVFSVYLVRWSIYCKIYLAIRSYSELSGLDFSRLWGQRSSASPPTRESR
jgi:hypothetical protein